MLQIFCPINMARIIWVHFQFSCSSCHHQEAGLQQHRSTPADQTGTADIKNCIHPEVVHVSFGAESALKVVLSCLLLCSINQLFIHQFLSQVLHLGSPCLIVTSVSFKFLSGCIKWIYYLLCRSFSLSPPGTSKTAIERRTDTRRVSEGLHQGDVSPPSESRPKRVPRNRRQVTCLNPRKMFSDPDLCQGGMSNLVQRFLRDEKVSGGVSAGMREQGSLCKLCFFFFPPHIYCDVSLNVKETYSDTVNIIDGVKYPESSYYHSECTCFLSCTV